MAKDLPEYQRRATVVPAANPVGFAEKTGPTTAQLVAGAIGSKIASEASLQYAKLSGTEAGQTPGKNFIFPAITENQKAYKDAYIEQSSQVLLSRGDQAFNDIALDFSAEKNPTGSSLEQLNENSRAIISDLTAYAPKETKAEVQRRLEQKYNNMFFQAAQKVQKADQQRTAENFETFMTNTNKNMVEYYTSGNKEAGDDTYLSLNAELESKREFIGEKAYNEVKTDIKTSHDYALANAGRMEAFREGGEPAEAKYIDQYHKTQHAGITNEEKSVIVGNLLKANALDSKARALSQDLAYSQFHTELIALGGDVPPERWREVKNKVSDSQFNSLQEDYIRLTSQAFNRNKTISAISRDKDDARAMTNYSTKEVEDYFKEAVNQQRMQIEENGDPYTNPILHEAAVASTIKAKIPLFVDGLEKSIQYGDAQQAIDASKAIAALGINNPIAIDGIDKDVRSTAYAFNTLRENTKKTDEESLKEAKGTIFDLSPDVREERRLAGEKWMSESQGANQGSYNTNNALLKALIEKNMGGKRWFGKNTVIPDGMVQQFRTLMPLYYNRIGNKEQTIKEIAEDIGQIYVETRVNHRPEFMKNAPEQVYPNMNTGSYLDNDKAYALHKMIEENKKLRESNGAFVMNTLDWADDPFVGKDVNEIDLISKPLISGNPKILLNGKEVEVVIKSDALTMAPQNGVASWSFYAKSEKSEVPISDPTQFGGIGRWYADTELYGKQLEKIPRDALRAAKLAKEINDNSIHPELMDSDAYWILKAQQEAEANKND